MTTITVQLEQSPQPHHLPIILADGVGLFEQRDLEVELTTPADPYTFEFAEGTSDLVLCLTTPLHLVVEHFNQARLMGIGRIFNNEAAVLLSHDVNADQPGDLSGPLEVASQGLPPDIVKSILQQVIVEKEGELSADEISVSSPDNPVDALIEGDVDLLFPAWLVPDVTRAQKHDADSWYFPTLGLPDAGDLIVAGPRESINSLPNQAQSFLDGIHTALQRILDDTEQANQILTAHASANELEYEEAVIENSFEGFTTDLDQNSDSYRRWGDYLEQHAGYDEYIDLDQIMDERFIPFDAMDLSF